jgi:hypothetical protein
LVFVFAYINDRDLQIPMNAVLRQLTARCC